MGLRDILTDPTLLVERALIGGQWIDSKDRLEVNDPATGEIIGHVPDLSGDETEQAIAAADKTFAEWRRTTAQHRSGLLKAWYRLIVENAEDLATILTAEQGKPLAEARAEILYSASFVEWFAEEAIRAYGDIIPSPNAIVRILALRQPIGVAAAITPWNFPSAMITRKVAPALAAGCTVVVKPSEITPFSATAIGLLAQRAGIPTGALNIVTGRPRPIGAALCASPTVRKLSFTGSTAVGKYLFEACAPTLKKLSLELGGNAPFIIFNDADLSAATEGLIASKFRNSGQTCVCANRIYVQDGIYDAFADHLATRVKALTMGNGRSAGVQIGPLINQQGLAKVLNHLEDAVSKGAGIVVGGTARNGTFFTPTVLRDVNDDMKLANEETFGPIAPLFRFKTEEEAITRANATPFGLASYIYTRDVARVFRVTEALDFGMVGVNHGSVSTAVAPFGGVKESGLGREGARQGLDEYLEIKAVHLGNIG